MIFLSKIKSMIKITPAILTSDFDDFISLFLKYTKTFNSLDIDIAEVDFANNNTISLIDILDSGVINNSFDIGIHLMVKDPIEKIRYLILNGFKEFDNLRIYIHQEADIDEVEEFLSIFKIGLVIKKNSILKDLDFYSKFNEIQLMTIDIGKQGSTFDKDSLKRADQLRSIGFKGEISLDGGVNMESANLIRKANPDRVSVGSYFQKSKDLLSDYNNLNELLNN